MALPLRQHCLTPTKSRLSPQNALPRRSFLKLSDRRDTQTSPPPQLTIKEQKPSSQNGSLYSPLLVRCSRDHDEPQSTHDEKIQTLQKPKNGKSFWAAVSLIIGTAVGPGMLGLPAATIRSGSIPSTVALLCSWVYVISSILLVAELSFAAMEEDNASEVSFTGLATKSFGDKFGVFVASVYASLSFALMVACVSGIGSICSLHVRRNTYFLANSS